MARYHIETYGCTANRGESRQIERALRDGGHHPADGPDEADVAILNTCTVVEKTERNMLRRAEELDAETPADLVVTGCMALAQGEEFAQADLDAEVLHWDEVPEFVRNGECPTTTPDTEPVLDGVVGILPIARGCMSDCSYCITKHATGKIDSPSVEENLEKARALVHAGAREIRITGQDTGVYGWDEGERKLHVLLDRICSEIEGDFLVADDPRTTAALKGYVLAAVDVLETGTAFCDDERCRLYDAHRQPGVVRAQLRDPEFCEEHAARYGYSSD